MIHDARAAHAGGRRSMCAMPPRACSALTGRLKTTVWLVAISLALAQANATASDLVERNSYDDAVQSIPFDRMTDDAQARLWRIISQPTLFRRLPVARVDTDPDLYLFLVRNPEVVVNMWDLMGVTKAKVKRTSAFTFDATDGAGTTSQVELIYGDRETHVMVAQGNYEGPLFKKLIEGRCVLLLKSQYGQSADGQQQVTHRLDIFVQLDNVGAELIAKTLSPVVGQAADHNFLETSRFLGQVSQAAATRPTGMAQLSGRLTKIEPAVRDQFAQVTAEVYRKATGGLIPVRAQ